MNTRKLGLSALLIASTAWPVAHAADGQQGANILALGGASVADPEDNTTLLSNPAMLGMTPRYDFSGSFFLQPDLDHGWNLNAVDSSKGIVAFGAGWERGITNPPLTDEELPGWVRPGVEPTNLRRTSLFTAAFSITPKDRKFSFGVSGTMGTSKHDRLGKQLTGELGVGLGWRPSEVLTLGLAGRDLLPTTSAASEPASVLAGLRYGIEEGPSFTMDAGWQIEDHNGLGLQLKMGAEAAFGIARPRLGYAYDGPLRQSHITAGFGGENDAGAVDLGVDLPVGGEADLSDTRIMLSVRLRT